MKEIKPSFFKVLIGDFSKKLRIPPAFVKNFNGICLGKITLASPSRDNWVIKMEKDVNGLSFGSGWQEFVKHHSLEVGDFLVFKYHGGSKFSVKIFGKTSCEKGTELAKTKNDRITLPTNNENQKQARGKIQECKLEDREADNENFAKQAMYHDESRRLRSGKKRAIIGVDDKPTKRSAISFEDTSKKFVVLSEMKNDHPTFHSKNVNQNKARVTPQECKPENREADCGDIYSRLNARHLRPREKNVINKGDKPPTRSALSFKSENSCFIATFTDLKKYCLTIPREFARQKNLMRNKMVKLKDPSGKSWQVKIHIRPLDGRVDLKGGWNEFCKANRIESNDTLIFESMQSSVMQVHIFRQEGSKPGSKTKMFNAAKAVKIEARS
ncbi:hypothetical protein Dsin_003381 [Dipteronia sinensis]|uniref:TF-B3 domain-containing protein n=1 Tax=Dipteronia sinensis TaxID=43782 RepID=A0AAE0B915_9ROSI|nr:hypothetical protein Dsin_003381 [Dipteronia sinensis]